MLCSSLFRNFDNLLFVIVFAVVMVIVPSHQRVAGTGAGLGGDGDSGGALLPVLGGDADLEGGESEDEVDVVLHAGLQLQVMKGGSAAERLTVVCVHAGN